MGFFRRLFDALKRVWRGRSTTASKVVLSPDVTLALSRLGLGAEQFSAFAEGIPVGFLLTGAAPGTTCIAHFPQSGKLRVGMYTIENEGGGLMDFLRFDVLARAAARAMGLGEVELLAIAVNNLHLQVALDTGRFLPTTIDIPAELGGGTAHAVSRVFPVD